MELKLQTFAFVFLVVFLTQYGTRGANVIEKPSGDDDYPYDKIMLPGDIEPVKYHLSLHPNVTHTLDYTGTVKIFFKVIKDTKNIILHSLDITHYDTVVQEVEEFTNWENVAYQRNIQVTKTLKSRKLEQAMVQCGETLNAGKSYMLSIDFYAPLRSQLRGFYKSSHVTPQGVKKYIATSHFEPTGARLAFPCLDEPSLKATFKVVLVREQCCTALSNMPREKMVADPATGLIREYFQDSVKMSTYLVAFIVGEVAKSSSVTKRGIKVNVYVPDYQIEQAEYATEITPKILDFYEEFFQLQFPLPKLDLIGIPDFGAGAMENWGLVTYRMTNLLCDPKETSNEAKTYVAKVIAHELAHQWFGNLVTMKWWSDLWLNEGFAAFTEYLGTAHVGPTWKYLERFPIQNVQDSMSVDSHLQTHPIKVLVKNPADIGSLFDHAITYNKGSSLIRMLREFMGEKAFGKGLNGYLQKYKFSNAESDDLWSSLSVNTSVPVSEIMNSWIWNPGYPVINVEREEKNGVYAHLTQERFLTDVDVAPVKNASWEIPLTWVSQFRGTKKRAIFKKGYKKMHLKYPKGWLKLNAGQFGFYRVNYDSDNWQALIEQLQTDHTKLQASDRSNLIDDVFALAMAGRVSETLALDLMEYFPKETEWAPVKSASLSLGFIDFMLSGRPGHALFEKYMLKLFGPLIDQLGFQDIGSYQDKMLRSVVMKVAVEQNHAVSVSTAKQMYHEWMIEGRKISVNLRDIVYYAGLKYGGEAEWNFMFEQYKSSKVPTEKQTLMFALTSTSDPVLLKKYLDMMLDDNIVKSQDTCYVIEKIGNNPLGREMAYHFLTHNWPEFEKRYKQGINFRDLVALFNGIFSTGKTKSDLAEWERFFSKHKGGGKLAADQAKANIQNHIAWLERSEEVVVQWLKKNV